MKGKRLVVEGVIVVCLFAAFIYYLQFGREMEVLHAYSSTSLTYRTEHISVVVNKIYISDQECCAEEIINRCKKNTFKGIRFQYDQLVPNELYVAVYRSKEQARTDFPDFSFSYLPEIRDGSYNILDDADKFCMVIKK